MNTIKMTKQHSTPALNLGLFGWGVAVLLAIWLLSWGEAQAKIPDANGVFYGCYMKSTGAIKIIDAGVNCKQGETLISWNQKGQKGIPGVRGIQGIQGIQGPSGLNTTPYAIGGQGPCGIVFSLSPDLLHGLEAETQDQGAETWFNAQNLISDPANHSSAGNNCRDWRLPTKFELNLVFGARVAVGGFANGLYWSSTEFDSGGAWYQAFANGYQDYDAKDYALRVRAVRAF